MADWDITLAGTGYMLAPKTYQAMQDGFQWGDSRLGRQVIADFSAGANLRHPERVGGRLSGLGPSAKVWPAPVPDFPRAVTAAPKRQELDENGAVTTADPKLVVPGPTHAWIIHGERIVRWDRAIAAPMELRLTATGDLAACAALLRNDLYIGWGTTADVSRYDPDTNTQTASALGAGVQASLLTSFARSLCLVAPAYPTNLHVYYGTSLGYLRSWNLTSTIRAFCPYGDDLVVVTHDRLYRLSGHWYQDTDPPAPEQSFAVTEWATLSGQLQDDDDFAWLVVHAGRLFGWVGKAVVWLDTRDGGAWWRHAGLEGAATHGAAVVNGFLVVSIQPGGGSGVQLWASDGSGWWLLDEAADAGVKHIASDGAGKLLAWGAAASAITAYDLGDRFGATTFATPVALVTPALDGEETDRGKHWRALGVQFARLDGQGSGSWTAQLAYSTDGGQTWTNAGPATAISAAQQTLTAAIAVDAAMLQARLTLTQTSGLPPYVAAVWAEYEVLNESVRRRKWQFQVRATDDTLDRAGLSDGRTGQQIRAALWSIFDAAATVTFRPPEYADELTEYSVRLTQLREEWDFPADQPTLGAESTLSITLVEV